MEQILRLGIDSSGAVTGADAVMKMLDRLVSSGEKTAASLDRLSSRTEEFGKTETRVASSSQQDWEKFSTSFSGYFEKNNASLDKISSQLDKFGKTNTVTAKASSDSWKSWALEMNQSFELVERGFGYVQKAWDFSRGRAEAVSTAKYFKAQAAEMGVDFDYLKGKLQSATEGTVTGTELMRSSMVALRKGVTTDVDQLAKLYMIAKAKSDEGFGGTIEIFEKMTSAITTGRKQTLIEMGFLSDAFKKGKDSAEILMNRDEALNSVLQQGAKDIDFVAKAGESAANSFARFDVEIGKIKGSLDDAMPLMQNFVDTATLLVKATNDTLRLPARFGKALGEYMGTTTEYSYVNVPGLEKIKDPIQKAVARKNYFSGLMKFNNEQMQNPNLSDSTKESLAGQMGTIKQQYNLAVREMKESAQKNAKEGVDYISKMLSDVFSEKKNELDNFVVSFNKSSKKRKPETDKSAREQASLMKKTQDELNKANEEELKLKSENADWSYKILQNQKNIAIESGRLIVNEDLAWKAMVKAVGASAGLENSFFKMVPMSAELSKNVESLKILEQLKNASVSIFGERYTEMGQSLFSGLTTQKTKAESFFGSIEGFVTDFYSEITSAPKQKSMADTFEKTLSKSFTDALLDAAKSGDWQNAVYKGLSNVATQAFANKFPVVDSSGDINWGNLGTNIVASAVTSRLFGTGGLFSNTRVVHGAEAITQAGSINDQVKAADAQRWQLYSAVGLSASTAQALNDLRFANAGYSWSKSGDGIRSKKTTTYSLNAAAAQESLKKFSELQEAAELEIGLREIAKSMKALTDPLGALEMQLEDLKSASERTYGALARAQIEYEKAQLESQVKTQRLGTTQGFLDSYLSNPYLNMTVGGSDLGFGDGMIGSMTSLGTTVYGSNANTEAFRQKYFGRASSKERAVEYDLYKQSLDAGDDPEKLMAYQKKLQDSMTGRLDTISSMRDNLARQMEYASGSVEEQLAVIQRYQQVDEAYWKTKKDILDNEQAMTDLLEQKQSKQNAKIREDILGTLLTRVGEVSKIGGKSVVVIAGGSQNDSTDLVKRLTDASVGLDPTLAAAIGKIISNVTKQNKGKW